jgi:hypothetical protein
VARAFSLPYSKRNLRRSSLRFLGGWRVPALCALALHFPQTESRMPRPFDSPLGYARGFGKNMVGSCVVWRAGTMLPIRQLSSFRGLGSCSPARLCSLLCRCIDFKIAARGRNFPASVWQDLTSGAKAPVFVGLNAALNRRSTVSGGRPVGVVGGGKFGTDCLSPHFLYLVTSAIVSGSRRTWK